MLFLDINKIRYRICNFNSYQIFIISFLICVTFYMLEGVLGIDRLYHPDSSYYLKNIEPPMIDELKKNPTYIFTKNYFKYLSSTGYMLFTNLLNDNYYFLIITNFILYSFTNIIIYRKVYNRYFKKFDNVKLFCLFYLFFLDPYRLHLASHVLKETFLIFFLIILIISKSNIIRILSVTFMEIFRANSWVYIFIFFTYSNIKKIFKKKIYLITSILVILSFGLMYQLDTGFYNLIHKEINNIFDLLIRFNDREMPLRSYDNVHQFKNYDFPIGFILKNIFWPTMFISGLFIFFVSSYLFKFLGIIILLNNLIVYLITKKTFISLGLILILVMISIYTSSYTAMFRYSYIALYTCLIYFFFNLNLKGIKSENL